MEEISRLNKYISDSGLCSRRAADRYIEQGVVFINGRRARVGDKAMFGDVIVVNGQTIEAEEPENSVILAFNKPTGITSTTESKIKDNIVDYVNYSERVFPVGRLDKESQGLIFLTNNGDIVNKILRAGNNHEKEYVVTVNKPITEAFVDKMSKGVPVLGVMTKKCKIKQVSPFVFNIILVQGLNRQIRRMCEHFGYEVTKLERTRIMNISLKGLPLGEWRVLDEKETSEINKLVVKSNSTIAPPAPKATKSKAKGKPYPADAASAPEKRRSAPSGGKGPSARNTSGTPDWNKTNGPSKRPTRPTKGRSGAPAGKKGSLKK